MATEWNNLRTFTTKAFRVTLDWAWEDYPDLSWDDTGEVLAKCESGEWGVYLFRVRVTYRGEEVGRDYLGNSIYADPAEFESGHRDPDPMNRNCSLNGGRNIGHYFPDMVRTAVAEARQHLTTKRPYIRAA